MMKPPKKTCGIIVGANATIEYLLPYFYLNFRLNSSLPIVFFDFGLSAMGLSFCEKRGEVIKIEKSLYPSKADEIKTMWFKKPLACKKAPFDVNLWLDLDCKILHPLDLIFHELTLNKWLAICPETHINTSPAFQAMKAKYPSYVLYNSGVIVFEKNSPFIDKWIEASLEEAATFRGDQDVLSYVLMSHKEHIAPLPSHYNSLFFHDGEAHNKTSSILHYIGPFKDFLQKEYLTLENVSPSTFFESLCPLL